ncbi:hypothetical protein PAMP_021574 [Pampus punctatissimus]
MEEGGVWLFLDKWRSWTQAGLGPETNKPLDETMNESRTQEPSSSAVQSG